jgi:small subunit ribosomal protein S3
LQKTPMGSRVTIRTAKPGLVIGYKGSKIKELTDEIKSRFNVTVPTIDVETVKEPELHAQIMAEKLSYAIEKGQNYRRAAYSIIRKVMTKNVKGIEISISGKMTSQRARRQTFRAGVIAKAGTPALDGVDNGVCHCILKSGVMGIQVHIMRGDYRMPDEVTLKDMSKVKKKKQKLKTDLDAVASEAEPVVEETEEEIESVIDDISEGKETILKTEGEKEANPITPPTTETKDEVKVESETPEETKDATEEPKKTTKKRSRKKSTKKDEEKAEGNEEPAASNPVEEKKE